MRCRYIKNNEPTDNNQPQWKIRWHHKIVATASTEDEAKLIVREFGGKPYHYSQHIPQGRSTIINAPKSKLQLRDARNRRILDQAKKPPSFIYKGARYSIDNRKGTTLPGRRKHKRCSDKIFRKRIKLAIQRSQAVVKKFSKLLSPREPYDFLDD